MKSYFIYIQIVFTYIDKQKENEKYILAILREMNFFMEY